MFQFQAVGFGCILAFVVLGVDYHQQTLKSELELGELTPGAYLNTITARFSDVQEAKQAQVAENERKSRVRAGARGYLPDAPEGWTRRELIAGDNSQIMPPERVVSEIEQEALDASPMLKNMASASEKRAFETRNAQTWVYERGDEIIAVRARFAEAPKGNSITANAMMMVAGNMEAMSVQDGWGVIQGVAFGKYRSFQRDEELPYETLTAVIGFGDEIKISVHTNASDTATRDILNQIDYDGLNALLPRPVDHVGSTAPIVPPEAQVAVAEQIMEIRSDLIRKRTNATEEWLKSASSPEDAMTLALRQAGLNVNGSMGEKDAELAQTMQELQDKAAQGLAEQADEQEAGAGRFFDVVAGFFGSSDSPEDEAGQAGADAEKERVKRLGAGSSFANCSTEGAFKKCTLD